jgi:type IV secretion system protein TrbL
MDPSTVNSFLDRFLAVADSGFGLIQGDVHAVLNGLIVISITLAGLQWALAGEAPVAPFFRKVLFVGFFAFLINNFDHLTTIINQSGAELGLKAGGGTLSLADLHNPGRVAQIGVDMFGRTTALAAGMNIITDFMSLMTIYIAAIFVMFGFFVLALQLFVALIAFKLGSLAAFVALPWGVFSGTAWVAERPLGWVAGSAVRLFVLALVASISMSFAASLPATLSLDAGGALNVLLFGFTVFSLAWFAPALAGEVVQGQPQLAATDAWRTATGSAVTAIGAGVVAYQGVKNAVRFGGAVIGGVNRAFGGGYGGGGRGSARGGRGGARPTINYARMVPRPAPSISNPGGTT